MSALCPHFSFASFEDDVYGRVCSVLAVAEIDFPESSTPEYGSDDASRTVFDGDEDVREKMRVNSPAGVYRFTMLYVIGAGMTREEFDEGLVVQDLFSHFLRPC